MYKSRAVQIIGVLAVSVFAFNCSNETFKLTVTELGDKNAQQLAQTPPAVTQVTSSDVDRTYILGETIHIEIIFDQAVTVDTTGGVPTIALDTTQSAQAAYTGISADKKTLYFQYTVKVGDSSADLQYSDTAALALNGATIVSVSGVNAALTLPFLASASSLAGSKNLAIDTVIPSITGVSASPTSGTFTDGQVITITMTFDNAVSVSGIPEIQLNGGGVAYYSSQSAPDTLVFTYMVAAGNYTANFDYTSTSAFSLPGGSAVTSSSGNAVSSTLATPGAAGSIAASLTGAFLIDAAPNVIDVLTVTPAGFTGPYTNGDTIQIQLVFDEAIDIAGAGAGTEPTLNLGMDAGGPAVAIYTGLNQTNVTTLNFSYTVDSNDIAAALDYANASSLSLNGSSIYRTGQPSVLALLSLPAPGATGSIAGEETVVVTQTPPVAREVQFTSIASSAAENAGTINLAVSLTTTAPNDVIVNYAVNTVSSSAKSTGIVPDHDYILGATGTVTIPAGQSTVNLGVDVLEDLYDEPDETLLVQLTGVTANATIMGGFDLYTLTITDNDAAPSISILPNLGSESVAAPAMQVNITGQSSRDIVLNAYTTGGVTNPATAGSDYTAIPNDGSVQVTFLAGDLTPQFVTLAILEDANVEVTENITLNLDPVDPALISNVPPVPGTYQIQDNDGNPVVLFDSLAKSVSEAGTKITFNAYLSGPSAADIIIDFYTTDGTALAGSDFTGIALGTPSTVTFPAGDYGPGLPQPVEVLVTDDLVYEGNQNFTITVGLNSGTADIGAPGNASQVLTATINDDEAIPTITVVGGSPVAKTETDADVLTGVAMQLDIASETDITIDYSFFDSSAINTVNAGADYTGVDASVTFTAGVDLAGSQKTVPFTVKGDTVFELAENFQIHYSLTVGPVGTTIPGITTVNITDNEPEPLILTSVANTFATFATEDVNATAAISITPDRASSQTMSISYAIDTAGLTNKANDPTPDSDFTVPAATGTQTWVAGDVTPFVITATIIGDTVDELDEQFNITVTLTSNAAQADVGGAGLTASIDTLTILDNDAAPTVSFALSNTLVEETGLGQNVEIVLSHASSRAIQIDYSDTGLGTATSGVDYNAITPGNIIFNPGVVSNNITVTPVQDNADDPGANETIELTIAVDAGSAGLAANGAIMTANAVINDLDLTPNITITDVTQAEGSPPTGAGTFNFTVAMDAPSTVPVSISYATQDGTTGVAATAGSDYTAIVGGSHTWVAGNTANHTIALTVATDHVVESDETADIDLTLTSLANTATITKAKGIATITNDDTSLTIVSAETLDCAGGQNGQIDHMKLTFSENISDASITGYVDNLTVANISAAWAVGLYANPVFDPPGNLDTACDGNLDAADDSVIYIAFDESGVYDTGATPDVTATGATLATASGKTLYNTTGNVSTLDIVETDTAPAWAYNVTSPVADAYYTNPDVITVRVFYSEDLAAVGTTPNAPRLQLATAGLANNFATYSGAMNWLGTNDVIIMTYTVNNGDNTADLDYLDANALHSNDGTYGTITDLAGNNVNLTLPTPGAAGSLSANKNIKIDTSEPTVLKVTSVDIDGTYGLGTTINVDVVFNEAITINNAGGNITLKLLTHSGNSTTRNITCNATPVTTSVTGDTLRCPYAVQSGDSNPNLDYWSINPLTIPVGSSIKDVAANNALGDFPMPSPDGGVTPGDLNSLSNLHTYIVDGIVPTVTGVAWVTGNGSYKNGDADVQFTVTFSEAIDTTGAPSVLMSTGNSAACDANATNVTFITCSYVIQATDNTGITANVDTLNYNSSAALTGTITRNAGAGNAANLNLPGTTQDLLHKGIVILDNTKPTITGIASSTGSGTYGTDQIVLIEVTFDEAVSDGAPSSTLDLNNGSAVVATYASQVSANVLRYSYQVVAGDSQATALDVTGVNNTIRDMAGNTYDIAVAPNGLLNASNTIIIDTSNPTIASVSVTSGNGTFNSGAVTIRLTFSETVDVTVDGLLELALNNNNTTTASVTPGLLTGISTLDLTYTIDSDNIGSDDDTQGNLLDYLATSSLTSAATIVSSTTSNPLSLTLPSPGGAGSIAANSSVYIDAVEPTVLSVNTSVAANSVLGVGQVVNAIVQFSESLDNTVTGSLALNTTPARSATGSSYSTTTLANDTLTLSYTIVSGDSATRIDYADTGSLTGGLKDVAGNLYVTTAGLPALTTSGLYANNISINTATPTVEFAAASASGDESVTPTITLQLSATVGSDVIVNYSVAGGGADAAEAAAHPGTGNIDYTLANGSVTIPAGSLTATINAATTVNINDDIYDEPNETFVITLDSVPTANADHIAGQQTYTYTINDNDVAPNVSFNVTASSIPNELNDSVNVPPSVATDLNIGVTLSVASEFDVTVPVQVTGGTAAIDNDGVCDTADLCFGSAGVSSVDLVFSSATGETAKNAVFTPVDDAVAEGANETVILGFGTLTNAVLGGNTTHTITITDDDGAPQISVGDITVTEPAVGAAESIVNVPLTMAGFSASDIIVDVTVIAGTATLNSDYNLAGTTPTPASVTWVGATSETGVKNIAINLIGDTLAEYTETVIVTVTLNASSGAATVIDPTGILSIANDAGDTSLGIVSAETLDCNPVDGITDHYRITFSEAISDSTIDGYIDNVTLGNITSKWAFAGHTNVRYNPPGAVSAICSAGVTDNVDDTIVHFKFTADVIPDTGVTPDITSSAATVQALSGHGKVNYNTGNTISSDLAETDKAKPYIWQATATHVGGVDGSAGTSDTLTLVFSEKTNAAALPVTDLDNDLCAIDDLDGVSGVCGATVSFGALSDIASAVWSTTNNTNDTLTITFATNNATVNEADYIKLQGSNVADLSGNLAATPADVLSPPAIGGTFSSGVRGPKILTATYMDDDNNGKIDHLKVIFDMAISDASFPGYTSPTTLGAVTTAWVVNGHTNVRIDPNHVGDNADDDTIYLHFSENVDLDTGSKPDLTATAAVSGNTVVDATNGCYLNTTFSTCLNNAYGSVLTTDVIEKDGAMPVMSLATARDQAKYIYVRFSENVWSNPGMPACGSGGQMTVNDFAYIDNTPASPPPTSNVTGIVSVDNLDTCAATDGTLILLSDVAFSSTYDINIDQIHPVANQIYDAANNAASDTLINTIYAVTKPYIISAGSYYNAGQYFIRVVFSEPMNYATTSSAANYTIIEDAATACPDFSVTPLSVTAISTTVFDLETGAQCGTGDASGETIYRVTGTTAILDFAEVAPLGTPNAATTVGTSATDLTTPHLLQAISTSSTTVQLTYSEPMTLGDVAGSAECSSANVVAPTCGLDVQTDTVDGTQFLYTVTPSLGNVLSVTATADPSVFILTHDSAQSGSFYTVTSRVDTDAIAQNDTPTDLAGNAIPGVPHDRTTFEGTGAVIQTVGDGPLFNDPFADQTEFSFAFNYNSMIYLGPNFTNESAFRFEPDGSNPTTVTFRTTGGSCTPALTFGYNLGATCGTDSGPNGERGIVGFNSGSITLDGGVTYTDILMVGTIKTAVSHSYFTQNVDTELDWTACSLDSNTGGANTESIQYTYTAGDSMYLGFASAHGTQAPLLMRQMLEDTNADGILECAPVGNFTGDLGVRSLSDLGKGAGNPAKTFNTNAVVGIDSMFYDGTNFYIANNGGVAVSAGLPTGGVDNTAPYAANTLHTIITQVDLGGVTLVLPDSANGGLEKVRPGQKGVPFIVNWNGTYYFARNMALDQTATGQTTPSGGEIWACSASCDTLGGWSKVMDISLATGGGLPSHAAATQTNNQAISMLAVNGDYLYIGIDNITDGVRIFKSNLGVTSINGTSNNTDFTEQADPGLGYGYQIIFSSSSLDKHGKSYIYVTVSDAIGSAIKVVRQVD